MSQRNNNSLEECVKSSNFVDSANKVFDHPVTNFAIGSVCAGISIASVIGSVNSGYEGEWYDLSMKGVLALGTGLCALKFYGKGIMKGSETSHYDENDDCTD